MCLRRANRWHSTCSASGREERVLATGEEAMGRKRYSPEGTRDSFKAFVAGLSSAVEADAHFKVDGVDYTVASAMALSAHYLSFYVDADSAHATVTTKVAAREAIHAEATAFR